MKVREDIEGVEDKTAYNYMQRSDHQHAPYNNKPPNPPQYSWSPAPPLRILLAPAHLQAVGKVVKELHWDHGSPRTPPCLLVKLPVSQSSRRTNLLVLRH